MLEEFQNYQNHHNLSPEVIKEEVLVRDFIRKVSTRRWREAIKNDGGQSSLFQRVWMRQNEGSFLGLSVFGVTPGGFAEDYRRSAGLVLAALPEGREAVLLGYKEIFVAVPKEQESEYEEFIKRVARQRINSSESIDGWELKKSVGFFWQENSMGKASIFVCWPLRNQNEFSSFWGPILNNRSYGYYDGIEGILSESVKKLYMFLDKINEKKKLLGEIKKL